MKVPLKDRTKETYLNEISQMTLDRIYETNLAAISKKTSPCLTRKKIGREKKV